MTKATAINYNKLVVFALIVFERQLGQCPMMLLAYRFCLDHVNASMQTKYSLFIVIDGKNDVLYNETTYCSWTLLNVSGEDRCND